MTESLDEENRGDIENAGGEPVGEEQKVSSKKGASISYKIGRALSYAVMSIVVALPFVASKIGKKK